MKTVVWISFLLLCGLVPKAQMDHHFGPLDPRPPRIPNELTYSTKQLAGFLQEQYDNEHDRTAAAYAWVTSNIRYSKDSMLSINWSMNSEDKIAATLRRRKGVCDNFASVFADILAWMNIPSYVVNGLARGNSSGLAHSWTAVRLSGTWYLCDPTWDAGPDNSKKFFLASPADFIASHWPFDPLWQLIPNPISLHEFDRGYQAQKQKVNNSIKHSPDEFIALDSLQQLEAQGKRMSDIGLEQNNLRNWYAYNKMNIAIIYGEQDMNLFNAAVADVNKANTHLNRFIEYRNNLFKPAVADKDLEPMLHPIDGLIENALARVALIGKGRENFQYDTGNLKEKIAGLQKRLEAQRLFLTVYLKSDSIERDKMFYQ